LADDYDTPHILEILRKDEDELLEAFWDLHTDFSAYLPTTSFNSNPEDGFLRAAFDKEALHKLSLCRKLVETVGGQRDAWQHNLDLGHTFTHNVNVYGSILDMSGSNPFGSFNPQKMLDALSKSPVFSGNAICEQDLLNWSARLMGQLPIGFSDGYLVCQD
jgi:hypothetical protein